MGLTIGLAIFGALIGIAAGIVLQRGRACTNTAFRNFLLFKNNELVSFVIITVCVELIGYYFLTILSIPNFQFNSNPISFSYIFIPLGGFIFGLGTVVAGGCAGGVCYRIGEGSGASLLAFVGFASGIVIVASSPLTKSIDNLRNQTNFQINNETPSLTHILP
ncbi:MAG: YeeE/YedE family protein, partial [Candidatus Heimdallarchaeota archaeon]|nr:YeeE/YedE family protein [Candidatus Heimdallarchaeota archaeon]